jgi:ABC-2 type transport system permease protein
MGSAAVILKKELADHLASNRFMILFALITMVSLITVYMAGLNIRRELEDIAKPRFIFLMLFTTSGALFSLVDFVAFFGPLIGLVLGFDTINRERNQGTLSKLLSQPIYRDAIINGKFLAGLSIITITLVSILLVISGLGLIVLGVVPGVEELLRMTIYLIISIVYISLWLGVAILFSIFFRSVATSALAVLAAWICFSFFIPIGANIVGGAVVPETGESNPDALVKVARIEKALSLISPMKLYTDSTATVVDPLRKTTRAVIQMGMMEQYSISRFSGPLPLHQSLLVVMPYIISLIAITAVCFAVSYAVFLRQEIRSL